MSFRLFGHADSRSHGHLPQPVHGRFARAFEHLHAGQPLSSEDQVAITKATDLIGRFVGGHLDTEATLAKAQKDGLLDDKTELYTPAAFAARIEAETNGLTGSPFQRHALVVAHIDGFTSLTEKFGEADAEDDYVVPTAARLSKHLPQGAFASRLETAGGFAAFMPDTGLVTAEMIGQQAIYDIAAIKLPRTIDGFNHLGLSIGIARYEPFDDLSEQLTAIRARMEQAYASGHDLIVLPERTEVGLAA